MFCPNCGSELSKEMTLCGKCRREVKVDGLNANTTAPVDQIELASLTGDLANCRIEILDVTAEGPDAEGALKVTAKYKLKNDLAADWDYLVVQMQILNAFGHVICTTSDEIDQKLQAGQSRDFEANFYYINSALFSGVPERAFVVGSVIASKRTSESMGSVQLPDATLSTVPLKPVTIGGTLKLISGSVWKGAVYGHNEYSVNACVLMQSVTNQSLSRVNLALKVSNRSGDEVYSDSRTLDAFIPGTLVAFQFECASIRKKKLSGASVHLDFDLLTPVASGLAQRQGIVINDVYSTEKNDKDAVTPEDTTEEVTLSNEQESRAEEWDDSQEQDESTEDIDIEQWKKDYHTGKVHHIRPIKEIKAIFNIERMGDTKGLCDIASSVSEYLDYVMYYYCDWKGTVQWGERDRLIARDGPYSDILAKVYEWDNGEPPPEDFYDPELGGDYDPCFDALWGYMMDRQSVDELSAFIYRYIVSMRYPEISSEVLSFEIPSDFDERKIEILKREMERTVACYIISTYENILNEREADLDSSESSIEED